MIKAQFIDEDYLFDNTLIEKNVDPAKINPMIFKAQDMHIATALGSSFYNHLMVASWNSSTSNPAPDPLLALTSEEEELMIDFIQPALAEWTHYMVIAQLRTKFTNKSASQEFSQYSNSAERQDIQDIKGEVRDMAEFYTQRLIKHLCLHSEDFPEYTNPEPLENLRRNNVAYSSGVYLKNRSPRTSRDQYKYKN